MAEDKHRTKYYENFQRKHIDGLQHVKATEALKYALDIRKFEIELYWKRTTYFWAIIAAIFTGFGVSSNADMHFLQTLLGGLGLVFSLGWYLANRGSKHWQQNWEQHVDMLEDPVIGPLYKTVFSEIPRKDKEVLDFLTTSAPYSVSKINQLISVYVTLIWLIILGRKLIKGIPKQAKI
ncbi:RipA family octameric membrane protein [Kordiimonas aestuarii]|uniref:RipA family octameric membrane protein n=1 Tax=Kordiimonas aestuarii TaxID=1005925 RepID=UPI0021D3EB60|nr:hypothetical protein [Kordiimonas aestuarii]